MYGMKGSKLTSTLMQKAIQYKRVPTINVEMQTKASARGNENAMKNRRSHQKMPRYLQLTQSGHSSNKSFHLLKT